MKSLKHYAYHEVEKKSVVKKLQDRVDEFSKLENIEYLTQTLLPRVLMLSDQFKTFMA